MQWKENGVEKSAEVDVGKTVVRELVFADGDVTKEVKFAAKRKDNDETVLLNGRKDVSFVVTTDRRSQSVVGTNMPRYIVAELRNDAAVPIVVQWKENGVEKSAEVDVGKTVVRELVFADGDVTKEVKFAAKRKDNDETVLLNGRKDVSLVVTTDRRSQSVVGTNVPRYIVAELRNDAAVPIVVQWKENGVDKSAEVDVGKTVVRELVFADGDVTKEVKFAAKRKDNDETVLLNGRKDVSFVVTTDRRSQSVVGTNMPRYIVAELRNDAAVPIVVQWKENGVDKSAEVDVGKTVVRELVFADGDVTKEVKFAAKRKDNDETVLLNGRKDVSFVVTTDRRSQSVVGTNMPRYIVAELRNDAAVPIVVQWKENGVEKSAEVDVGKTVVRELVFADGDVTKEVKFAAKRKDNDDTVLLNGRKDVSFVVTTDRRSQSVVGTNVPRYIVAELRNDAAVPIVVQWKENGVEKSAEVDVGKTVVRELVFADGDVTKEVKFAAKRKDNDETVLLNGRKDVSFVVTTDRRSQSVVGTNMPRYIVAELRNDAAVPIVVQWKENGVEKSAEVDVGKTVVRELVFADGDVTKEVKFAAKRKDNDETVLLNGRKDVSLVVTTDRRSQSVVGTNVPRYIVAELRNDAAVPIVVQWKENGVDKSAEVDVGKTVVRELVFADGDVTKEVKFAAKRKDNDETVLLNGRKDVSFVVTTDRRSQSVVGTNMPRYIVAELRNDAAVPIVVQWKENGVDKSAEVDVGKTVVRELVFADGDVTKEVKFAAKRKDNDETVLLNGRKDVSFVVTTDRRSQSVVGTNVPRYIVAELRNDAAVPIVVQWKENGVDKSAEVDVGKTVVRELVFADGDVTKEVKFAAKRKDNDETVLLNGRKDVSFVVTTDRRSQSVVGTNMPRYIVAELRNDAAVPIVVQWKENGVEKSAEVDVGKTVVRELVFADGDVTKEVKFAAKRKDNDETVLLNGRKDVSFVVTTDRRSQSVVGTNMPRYIVAELRNDAAVPIVVQWKENGDDKSAEVDVGKTVVRELVFADGDVTKEVKFAAKRKDNDETVLLNGRKDVSFVVTTDRRSQSVVGTNMPRYIVAELRNDAAVPIVVQWKENGVDKSAEVDVGKTVVRELVFADGDVTKEVKFAAKRKDNDETVLLNGRKDVSFVVTTDRRSQSVVGTNMPRYIVAELRNDAAVPIVVQWKENGVEKSAEVDVGKTVVRELVFADGDVTKEVKFAAKRKDNDETVLLNGRKDVSFVVTTDRRSQSVVGTNMPRYIVAELRNDAAVPIVVQWKENGVEKSAEVDVGKTVVRELVFADGDVTKEVKFAAKRKDNDETVLLNGRKDVSFVVTTDRRSQSVVGTNMPRYIVAELRNDAAVPIVVQWKENGVDKSAEVDVGKTVVRELVFADGDVTKEVKFAAKRKDNDETVLLNGRKDVSFVVTTDRRSQSVVGTNMPRYIVAELRNDAAVPIVVQWKENGVDKSAEVDVGKTVVRELVFADGDVTKEVKFAAKRKDNDETVLLNGRKDVSFVVTTDRRSQSVVGTNMPRYIVAELRNDAAVPIVVQWKENGVEKSAEVDVGKTVVRELVFADGDVTKEVKFAAKRKDNDETVLLNGRKDVSFVVTTDRRSQSVVGTNMPRYIVAELRNDAAVPIVVQWKENGVDKSAEVDVGKTVVRELVFADGDVTKEVKFAAKRKDNDETVLLNGRKDVSFVVTTDRRSQSVVGTNMPRYIVAELRNDAAVPIVVQWKENGVDKSAEVDVGKTVVRELVFADGDVTKEVKFAAKRKDNDETVLLNGRKDVSFVVTTDRRSQSVVGTNMPRYIVAELRNDAAVPIVVQWKENGVEKSAEVDVGKTVVRELVFADGDVTKEVKFAAKRKDNDETVLLNGRKDVSFVVTTDRRSQSVVGTNMPRYIVAELRNDAAVPIVVQWKENGVDKSAEVDVGKTVVRELVFADGDVTKEVKFAAKRKDNDETVLLNGRKDVSFVVTTDRRSQSVVGTNVPRYIVAELRNDAAVPIVVQWKENGVEKSAEVDVGKTVVRELVFADGDVTKEVKFAAKRKDNDETVLLNGRKDVSFVVTTDRRSQSVVGTNVPRYIVAELRNDAAVPIVVQWKENGVDKSAEVDVGKTVVRELVFADGDVTKEVKFAAKRKDNDETVLLNGRKDVSFVVTTDRRSQSVVGTNVPRYIVAELRNDAAVPIVVQWKENGVDKSAEVDVGKTVVRELVFADGDVTKEVKFAAKRKDNDETVLLNGRKDVSFVVTTDRRSQSVVGTNMPRYIVAELRNDAAVPIVVQWKENGVDKSAEVDVGKTVVRELVFADGDVTKEVKFAAKRKDNDETVLLNGRKDVSFVVTTDRRSQSVRRNEHAKVHCCRTEKRCCRTDRSAMEGERR